MRKLFVCIAMFAVAFTQAQKTPNPTPFAKTITADDLKKHLYIVAGKEMGGRETATEGERKAAAYIEAQFRAIGLNPGNSDSYQMPFPVYQDELSSAELEVNGTSFRPDQQFTIALSSAYNITLYGSEVAFAGYGISDSSRDDYKGINAKGRIVLLFSATPPPGNTQRRPASQQAIIEAAQRNGAAAILIVQGGFPRRPGARGNQYMNVFKRANTPNVFYIADTVARAIMGADFTTAQEAVKNGNPQPKIYNADIKLAINKSTVKSNSSNVVGILEGTDKKDEYVVLTAHYDHMGQRGDSIIYYGADDDGSGTVSIIELAEAFAKAKKEGKGPRRSIVFMTVSGEEKGLWGSAYYGDHPLFPLDKTTVNLNIDMIGRIDPKRKNGDSTNYVYVVGDDKLSTDLRPISEANNKKYTKLELDYKYNDPKDQERIYFRSDHYNFARRGVPIIFYFNGTHNDYHRPTDTPDKINYPLLAKRAQLVFYTAWDMANRNDMLKRDLTLDVGTR
jgi:hypothetical protein